jgi:hypothetical protein
MFNADSPKRGDETLVALSARDIYSSVSRIKNYVTVTCHPHRIKYQVTG